MKYLALLAGPAVGLIGCTLAESYFDLNSKMSYMVGLSLFMITWWLNGAVSMGTTGLLPIVFLPILGITSAARTSEVYFGDGIIICWGSLVVALAIEKYEIHSRFATKLIKLSSSTGIPGILLAFVVSTGFLSMWLSNTAAAALMTPLSRAVFSKLRVIPNRYDERTLSIAASGTDLSIAFSATLGGMATLTGTGANLALQGMMATVFESTDGITFVDWLRVFLPLCIINLLILWLVLMAFIHVNYSSSSPVMMSDMKYDHHVVSLSDNELMESSTSALHDMTDHVQASNRVQQAGRGHDQSTTETETVCETQERPLGFAECYVLVVFASMGTLWITRDPPGEWGWAQWLPHPSYVSDGTVALLCSLALLVMPCSPPACIAQVWTKCRQRGSGRGSTHSAINTHESVEHEDDEESDDVPKNTNHILDFHAAVAEVNWDVIFLLGGGFALSKGFQVMHFCMISVTSCCRNQLTAACQDSGLSMVLTNAIVGGQVGSTELNMGDLWELILSAGGISCAATNFMSNVAVANIILPALACVGPRYKVSPLYVLAPVTLCSSLALLFPIGTPPNAIVLANKQVSLLQMLTVGAICSALIYCTIMMYCHFIVPILLPEILSVGREVSEVCI